MTRTLGMIRLIQFILMLQSIRKISATRKMNGQDVKAMNFLVLCLFIFICTFSREMVNVLPGQK